METIYRPLQPDDYHALMALWNRTPGVRTTETPEMFTRFLARNPGLGSVAIVNEVIAGGVMCGHDSRRGYLYHLAVDSAYRRRGIARQLVENCLAQLALIGIEKCSAFLFVDNAQGRTFWQSLGWRERVDLVIMARDITIDSPSATEPGP